MVKPIPYANACYPGANPGRGLIHDLPTLWQIHGRHHPTDFSSSTDLVRVGP